MKKILAMMMMSLASFIVLSGLYRIIRSFLNGDPAPALTLLAVVVTALGLCWSIETLSKKP